MIILINATDYTLNHVEMGKIEEITHATTWQNITLGMYQSQYVCSMTQAEQDEFALRVQRATSEIIHNMQLEEINRQLKAGG